MRLSIVVSIVLLSCIVVTGCSKPESRFTGKWLGKTGSFEFMKDHTGVINPPSGVNLPGNVQFKWIPQNSDTVRIDVGPPVGKSFFGKLISKNEIVIEEDKFVRMK